MNRQVLANVRRYLPRIVLVALFLIGAFAGCQKQDGVKQLRFRTVMQGQGFRDGTVSFEERMKILVAATDEELLRIRESATELSYNAAIQVWDKVDMTQDVVVELIMVASTPYDGPAQSKIEVIDIIAIGTTVHLFVTIHENPPGTVIEHIVAYPYHIVAFPRSGLPSEGDVHFIVDTTESDRFAETTYRFTDER